MGECVCVGGGGAGLSFLFCFCKFVQLLFNEMQTLLTNHCVTKSLSYFIYLYDNFVGFLFGLCVGGGVFLVCFLLLFLFVF